MIVHRSDRRLLGALRKLGRRDIRLHRDIEQLRKERRTAADLREKGDIESVSRTVHVGHVHAHAAEAQTTELRHVLVLLFPACIGPFGPPHLFLSVFFVA